MKYLIKCGDSDHNEWTDSFYFLELYGFHDTYTQNGACDVNFCIKYWSHSLFLWEFLSWACNFVLILRYYSCWFLAYVQWLCMHIYNYQWNMLYFMDRSNRIHNEYIRSFLVFYLWKCIPQHQHCICWNWENENIHSLNQPGAF